MNVRIVCAIIFVSVLLVSLAVGIQIVKADSTGSTSPISVVVILSPANRTYNSRFLTLNVTFPFGMGMQYTLKYSVDRTPESSIPWTISDPAELHVIHDATGSVELSALSEGAHSLTVNLEASGFVTGQNPRLYSDTVYFTIDSSAPTVDSTPPNNLVIDTSPPNISNMSLENKTYLTPDVRLNFTVNENTSQVTYCLDGKDNVTIAGNTTLTGLSIGAHNLTVYAWDNAGNVGASQTVNFAITDITSAPLNPSEPFPTPLVVAGSGVSVATVGIGLLVYFRKRKKT